MEMVVDMIWRSSFNSAIARIADFLTAFLSYGVSYVLWRTFHLAYPTVFPFTVAFGWHYLVIGGIFGLIFVILSQAHKAYSYQRFTSLIW
ncbi:MAG: hypothetical protein M1587_12145 [Thaumarchaeota archaeon]|nr:hypothetical protein [Nitrososphaerota archaeon]